MTQLHNTVQHRYCKTKPFTDDTALDQSISVNAKSCTDHFGACFLFFFVVNGLRTNRQFWGFIYLFVGASIQNGLVVGQAERISDEWGDIENWWAVLKQVFASHYWVIKWKIVLWFHALIPSI